MTLEETLTQIVMFAALANQTSIEDVTAVVDRMNRDDAILPILNPTAWMTGRSDREKQFQTAQAFLAYRKALEKIT